MAEGQSHRCARRAKIQVNVDGQHSREAHVDHLQPGVRREVQAELESNPIEGPEGELALSHATLPRRSSRTS